MEKKTNSHKHHRQTTARSPSPQLLRSKSNPWAVPLSGPGTTLPSSSRSMTASKSHKLEPNLNPLTLSMASNPKTQKKMAQGNECDNKVRSRGQNKPDIRRGTRSASTSPSAWALSPGRTAQSLTPTPLIRMPKPPTISATKTDSTTKGNGGLRGVLGYFRRKKPSSVHEEEYHQFRIFQNRLLQWRFVNAKAQVSTTSATRTAQKSMINASMRIYKARNVIIEKRKQMVEGNMRIKVWPIVSAQLFLLDEWTRLESKSTEAVGRLARKLSVVSVSLPLIQGAKADVESFKVAMSRTQKIMDSTKATITGFQLQAEEMCYLLTELSVLQEELQESLSHLENGLALVRSFMALEKSLRVHQVQLAGESKRANRL